MPSGGRGRRRARGQAGEAAALAHQSFDALISAAGRAPRPGGAAGPRIARTLGRIISLAQYRDVLDQRLAHIRAAETAAPRLDAASRALAGRVMARLIGDLAALADGAGGSASDCFLALDEAAEDCAPDVAAELARLGDAGRRAAESLMDCAAMLADLADARAAAAETATPPGGLHAADLAWMRALYTMEEERESHDTALAAALMESA